MALCLFNEIFLWFQDIDLIDDLTFEPVRENEEPHEDVDLVEVVFFLLGL